MWVGIQAHVCVGGYPGSRLCGWISRLRFVWVDIQDHVCVRGYPGSCLCVGEYPGLSLCGWVSRLGFVLVSTSFGICLEGAMRSSVVSLTTVNIGMALKTNPGYLQLRKIQAAQNIASTVSGRGIRMWSVGVWARQDGECGGLGPSGWGVWGCGPVRMGSVGVWACQDGECGGVGPSRWGVKVWICQSGE